MTMTLALPHELADGSVLRQFASGKVAHVQADGSFRVLDPVEAANLDEYVYGPAEDPDVRYCSLCDGVGHGYPGGGPCPLEERGYWEAEADRDRYGAF